MKRYTIKVTSEVIFSIESDTVDEAKQIAIEIAGDCSPDWYAELIEVAE